MRIPRVQIQAVKFTQTLFASIIALTSLAVLSGCASDPAARQNLSAGEQSFARQQYDQTIQYANAAMNSKTSDVAPEAHYLRGRAIEDRRKADNAAAIRDLQAAAADYNAALNMGPTRTLEGMARMQLGNAMFRLDRYAEALQQWSVAQTFLTRDDLKMWNQYYIGVCQQRLGRFVDADATFQQVEASYPDSGPAQRAHQRMGLRGFYVQVGAFTDNGDAEKAASAILSVGGVPMKTTAKNMTFIRTDGVATYAQAVAIRSKLAGQYPDASVIP